jgi:hypothetical protein
LAGISSSKLVTWAAKAILSPSVLDAFADQGLAFGTLISGSRQKPDGTVLSWQLTDPVVALEQGLVPFLIDWGTSPHPAKSAVQGGILHDLHISHPAPNLVKKKLAILGTDMPVVQGPPGLKARIETKNGIVELGTL